MLRNSKANQTQRTSDYLRAIAPVLKDAGAKTVGALSAVIGPETPFLISVVAYPDAAAVEAVRKRLQEDKSVAAAETALHAGDGAPFERVESWLLRAFSGFPELRPAAEAKAGRIFELRRYESADFVTLQRKIGMFNRGESAIFERLGMRPVFFGEMLYGPKMPDLVYMLSFDDLAARDRLWQAFGSDPEWQKLRSQPGFEDSEIVTKISNWILRPMDFSEIR